MEYHRPVMPQEVLEYLLVDPQGVYVDCTLGGGGHSRLILERLAPNGRLIALDRDQEAVTRGQQLLQDGRVTIIHSPFSRVKEACAKQHLTGVLFDLGVSSHQIDEKARGFSFAPGTNLDMRMGQEGYTAEDIVRDYDEEDLALLFWKNSDIQSSRRLARALKAEMQAKGKINSDSLARVANDVLHLHSQNRNSMLARIFQALRMEVNQEMQEVEEGLEGAISLLRSGGRIAVLSYHSVEDRRVKETFAKFERDCVCPKEWPVCKCGGKNRQLRKVTSKPLLPSALEQKENPRSRSAKFRVVEKV